ncbi:MAG: hypothetical protein JRE64_27805 [Deltaproteobacteria bacterium]|nr:hypothetical protein [Deltaproteobacteria bacterium]
MRQTPSGKPHPGKGKGSNDMVRLIKCLQRRQEDRPKSFIIGNSVERGNPVFSPEVVRQVKP